MKILCETCEAEATHRNPDGSFACKKHAEPGAKKVKS